MKRKSKDDSLTPKKQNDLHFFFAKAKAKAEEKASDDSVVFLKEVKAPTPKGKKHDDPDWCVENEISASAKKRMQSESKDLRLRDVLRRRAEKKRITSKSKRAATKPSTATKPQNDFDILPEDDLTTANMNSVPLDSPRSLPNTRARSASNSPSMCTSADQVVSERKQIIPKSKRAAIKPRNDLVLSSDDDLGPTTMKTVPPYSPKSPPHTRGRSASKSPSKRPASDQLVSDNNNDSDIENEAMPIFSLKILDSQEYYSDPDNVAKSKGSTPVAVSIEII